MAVVRWDPWAELEQLQRDVGELFGRRGVPQQRVARPAMDAFRTDEGTVIRMDVPGFGPEDIQVAVQEGVLTLGGTREDKAEVGEGDWIRRERTTAAFERSIALPKGVDVDQIRANVDNGVLEVLVPHPEEEKPRRISVQSAGESGSTVDVGSDG